MILNKEAFNLALAQAELTKQEVAKKSGVAPSTITKLLSGNQEMQPEPRENCQGLRLQCNRDHRTEV